MLVLKGEKQGETNLSRKAVLGGERIGIPSLKKKERALSWAALQQKRKDFGEKKIGPSLFAF